MKILNFENFLNESAGLLKESISQEDTYLVGDSASILTGSGKEIKNKVTVLPDLSVVGIGTTKFSELLKKYNKTHPEAKFVFLFMGANDLYHINSAILKSAKVVKEELNRIFPNAQKFIAKAGSWGWGGIKNVKEDKVKTYYKRFENLGVKIIDPPIGKIEPHGNKPIYKIIGKNIDSLLQSLNY